MNITFNPALKNQYKYNTVPTFKAKDPVKSIENGIKLASAAITANAVAGILIKNRENEQIPVETILEMAKNGMSGRQIGIELNINRKQVVKVLNSNGYKTERQLKQEKYNDPELQAQIIEMAKEGKMPKEIANELNLIYPIVLRIYNENGFETNRQKNRIKAADKDFKTEVIRRFKLGESVTEIATDTGIENARIGKILKEAGYRIPGQKFNAYELADAEKSIIDCYNKGLSVAEIGKELNILTPKVLEILNKAGIYTDYQERMQKRHDETLKEQIIALALEGKSANQIIRITNVGRSTILQILKLAGVKTKKQLAKEKIDNPEFQASVVRMYNSGMSINNIEKLTEISSPVIRQILENSGAKEIEIKVEPEIQAQIISLAKQGYSSKQIVKLLNTRIGATTVLKIINNAGIKTTTQQDLDRINSEEFKSEVFRMYEQGLSAIKIAQELKVKNATILRILNDADIRTPKQQERDRANNKELREKAVELAKEGKNISEINEETNIGGVTIAKILSKAGISTENQARCEKVRDIKVNEQIIELFNSGKTPPEIAKLVGISQISVIKILNEAGIKTKQQLALEQKN